MGHESSDCMGRCGIVWCRYSREPYGQILVIMYASMLPESPPSLAHEVRNHPMEGALLPKSIAAKVPSNVKAPGFGVSRFRVHSLSLRTLALYPIQTKPQTQVPKDIIDKGWNLGACCMVDHEF